MVFKSIDSCFPSDLSRFFLCVCGGGGGLWGRYLGKYESMSTLVSGRLFLWSKTFGGSYEVDT